MEVVIRLIVNILLFLAFFFFFGRNSIEKYLKGDVTINRNEYKNYNVSPPGTNDRRIFCGGSTLVSVDIIILPEHTETSSGWKQGMLSYMDCAMLEASDEYETCVKSKGYSFDEAVLSYNGQFNSSYNSFSVHGTEHIIKPALGQIKYSPGEENTFSLTLNPSLIYNIAFVDPHYKVLSIHPTAIPSSKVILGPNSGVMLLYLKVDMYKRISIFINNSYIS